MKKLFLRFPILFIAIGLFVFYLFLVIIFFNSSNRQPDSISSLLTPTPVTQESVTVGSGPLTQQEASFPEPTPQPYRYQDETTETGTLVVTSDIDGVIVLLDAVGIHPEPEDPISRGEKWPQNPLPLTVYEMPVGTHFLTAVAPGQPYDMAEYEYEIRSNEVTRVHVTLKPLQFLN